MITFIITLLLIWTVAACVASSQVHSTFDPCSPTNHKPFPFMSDRCPNCSSSSSYRSDLFDLDHDKWYRAEFNMTTRYVLPYGCGNMIPIWMNGSIPELEDEVVNRTACAATFEKLCAVRYSIMVKRCGTATTVYCLNNLPSDMQQRYCFDFDPDIFTTTSSTTAATKLPSTRMDEERIPIYKETGIQSWVIAVIAGLSIAIATLVAVIIAILRQFRKNHRKYRTFPDLELPPSYKEATFLTPVWKQTQVIATVNIKEKY